LGKLWFSSQIIDFPGTNMLDYLICSSVTKKKTHFLVDTRPLPMTPRTEQTIADLGKYSRIILQSSIGVP